MGAFSEGAFVLAGAANRGADGFDSCPQAKASKATHASDVRWPIMQTNEYGERELDGKSIDHDSCESARFACASA